MVYPLESVTTSQNLRPNNDYELGSRRRPRTPDNVVSYYCPSSPHPGTGPAVVPQQAEHRSRSRAGHTTWAKHHNLYQHMMASYWNCWALTRF